MNAAAMRLELRLRDVHSLKEKRHVMNVLRTTVESKFSVGFAEVDHQDKWQRATVGIAAVATQPGQLERVLLSVRRTVDTTPGVEVLDYGIGHMEQAV